MKKSVSILFFLFTLTTNVYGGYDFINNQRVINKMNELADATAELTAFTNRLNTLGFSNVATKFNALSDSKKLDFYYDFRNSEYKLAQLNIEPNLIDNWEQFTELLIHRKNINVLKAYSRVLDKPWEFNHIRNLYDYPAKYKWTGAHWDLVIQTHLNNGNLKIFSAADLPSGFPPTTVTYINGHIKYENLYLKRPSSMSQGGEVQIAGIWYKSKNKQYVINPLWSEQRLKEEMAFAQANKKIVGLPSIRGPRFGRTENYIATEWESTFSDGTPIGLYTRNYDKDPTTGEIKNDHLALLFIK